MQRRNDGKRSVDELKAKITEMHNQRYAIVAPPPHEVPNNTPSIAATFGHGQTYVPNSSNKEKDDAVGSMDIIHHHILYTQQPPPR